MSCKFKKLKYKIDELKDDLCDFGKDLYEEIGYECFWPPINSFVGVTLMTPGGVVKNISGRFCGDQVNDCTFDLIVYKNGKFTLVSIQKKDVIKIKTFPRCPYCPC
ncbi:hypothetical protein [Tepidibacter hydrothermalis]|uniref:Uncharacterized protein n=1 Tax=Tepidibacter hydrothermalis TaxID=3036126 RepID=A0ABY8EBN6_9FIRM|nr:hypothetical protein [Tepidibacter hydrothermalis]WFD08922.1 hypothetical protein P4S50_11035 [Tepidibacter hydrothermalis]